MTIGEAIDLILLRANGGRLTQESAVQRADIRAYLPTALSYFLVAEMRQRRREAHEEAGFGGSESWFDGTFPGVYTLTPAQDADSKIWYIDLAGAAVSLPSGRGVQLVYPSEHPEKPFVRLANPSQIAGAEYILGDQVFFWAQNTSNRVSRIRLFNYIGPACPVEVWAILNTDCLADTAQMPAPTNITMLVIDKCVDHFTGTRQTPSDNAMDGKDVNALNLPAQ